MKSIAANFLGNRRQDQYPDIVDCMLKAYERLGARMSLKMHFRRFHLDFFPPNLGEVSNEPEEIPSRYIRHRRWYQGRFDANTMGDFCLYLQRESKGSPYIRKAK